MSERKRSRFPSIYYGWVLLGVAIIAGSFSTGVGVWGASVFVRPMTEELEWSRAAFYGALTFQMLVGGALAPIVGPMQDTRTGPMRLMLFSAVLLGASLIGLRYIDSLWQFYLLFGVSGGIAQITGGFALSMTILPKWFVRKRGRVLGIAAMGPGLGPMLYPVSLQAPDRRLRLAHGVVRPRHRRALRAGAPLLPRAHPSRGHGPASRRRQARRLPRSP